MTYYTYDPEATEKTVSITVDAPAAGELAILLLDETHDAEMIGKAKASEPVTLTLRPNSVGLVTNDL